MATKRKSRILDQVYEGASDLHRLGFIDKRRMGEFEVLCKLEVPALSARKIKALRESLHVSQSVLAALLNTSVSTVQKWEIGEKKPGGPSLKLLNLIERKGIEAVV
ncbi:MAG: DNA-binding transcriptional regulator [Proteobacteria bacterium]|nr:DNA-binding transcriptional regulator [Pseudomonadota bacterium]